MWGLVGWGGVGGGGMELGWMTWFVRGGGGGGGSRPPLLARSLSLSLPSSLSHSLPLSPAGSLPALAALVISLGGGGGGGGGRGGGGVEGGGQSKCISVEEDGNDVSALNLGMIAAYYYIRCSFSPVPLPSPLLPSSSKRARRRLSGAVCVCVVCVCCVCVRACVRARACCFGWRRPASEPALKAAEGGGRGWAMMPMMTTNVADADH